MKIAILCHASAGGSGVVATELALALAELGHSVHLIAAQRPFRLTDERLTAEPETRLQDLGSQPRPMSALARLVQSGRASVVNWAKRIARRPVQGSQGSQGASNLHFHEFLNADYPLFQDAMTPLTAANSLAKVIHDYGIEIVHAHYAIPHATSALMVRDMGLPIKVVTTLHGTDVTLMGLVPAFALTTKHAVLKSDAVTAVSEALAWEAQFAFEVERPIDVIHNWVDSERFKPRADPTQRLKYAQPEEAILVHVSNFREVKRPEDALHIFARVARQHPARLLMIGDGPLRPRCAELARELDLLGRVQFIESTPEVEKYLAVADLFLLPSEQESFGLAALEAMSCGVPVVASRVGGLPEVVLDGITGHLCPAGDVDAHSAAALHVLQDPEVLSEMRKAARARAITHFRPEAVVPRYLEVYQRVLSGETLNPRELASG